ncbi:hypothetical protein LCGC14_0647970 [marine sediment metagenome]|uniref:Uncharacterized protein n=1 Tax=marine sediment metagenome TaxID=412755 RepID=A0A0F9U5K2_9ZZZZ
MLGLVSNYTSAEHTIINGEISRWVSRLVEGDPQRKNRLFVVHYNKLGVFCICEWLAKPGDVFVDVLNLGKSLGNFGPEEARELRRRLFKPLSAEDTSRAIILGDSDYHHNLQDEDAEETERQERVAIGE